VWKEKRDEILQSLLFWALFLLCFLVLCFSIAKKLKAAAPACLKQKNIDGKTPADLAQDLGNTELAKLLKP
jgi:ABC-type transport system involved in multi-copper enzyme maturation permease subunit